MHELPFRRRRRSHALAKVLGRWCCAGSFFAMSVASQAQIECPSVTLPLLVFGGAARPVEWRACNAGTEERTVNLHFRLWQASSSTGMPVGELRNAKSVRILSGQTVIETVPVEFPAVQKATDFVVRWTEAGGKALSATRVLLLPADFLKQFSALTAGEPVVVFDPEQELGPLLERQGVAHVDLSDAPQAEAAHRLAVVGPFSYSSKETRSRPLELETLAKHYRAVVWVEAPSSRGSGPGSALRVIVRNGRTVVVVPSAHVSNLSESAAAQWQLVQAATFALEPQLAEPAKLQP